MGWSGSLVSLVATNVESERWRLSTLFIFHVGVCTSARNETCCNRWEAQTLASYGWPPAFVQVEHSIV